MQLVISPSLTPGLWSGGEDLVVKKLGEEAVGVPFEARSANTVSGREKTARNSTIGQDRLDLRPLASSEAQESLANYWSSVTRMKSALASIAPKLSEVSITELIAGRNVSLSIVAQGGVSGLITGTGSMNGAGGGG
jgi:hypothetical protein